MHKAILLILAIVLDSVAAAQLQTKPPKPVVLIELDTSGSMEYESDGARVVYRNFTPPRVTGMPTRRSAGELDQVGSLMEEEGIYQKPIRNP
ncbi:MAG: hypothetical protein ACE5FT_03015 [Candidatus Nanoarchaeia archaeon]